MADDGANTMGSAATGAVSTTQCTCVHETVTVRQLVDARPDRVWREYADPERRRRWSVPAGEELVVDHDEFRVGGRTEARCGTPGTLEYTLTGEVLDLQEPTRIVVTETVRAGDDVLSAALLTWHFAPLGERTLVTVIDQLVSFAGRDMIEGHRAGHTIALEQLADLVS